jgi:predicted house-cleaning noncanonical NTP pyrophosphatase (MazG superfamily)
MKESRLTPFDSETFIMIESITGKDVEVIPNYFSYTLTAYTSKLDDDKIESLINSVSGRLGKRLSKIDKRAYCVIFSVWYQKTTYDLPFEYSKQYTKPDETAGEIYCRRLLEVRALPVKRDNLEKLLMFTGGGTMQVPRTPGGLAVYSFPTENGVMLDVPEGNFIVLAPDGKFGKMDMQTFMANFEEKDANTAGLTFDEKRLFEKMNKLFGKNIEKRLGKLAEEYNELFEAFERYLSREKTQREINEINPGTHDIIDELADVNVVLFHIAALLGYSQKELQEMAYTKIAGREKNPEFMRKHPHKKPESPVCGNCNNFGNEDINGDGFCNEQNRMRHCSCLACNQWQEKQTAEEYKHFDERFNKRL